MLLLLDASLIAFFKFLQIFLWISIPALLIGMLITTVIHYKNKRKKKNLEEPLFFESEGSGAGYDDVSLMPLNLFLHGNKEETRRIMNYLSHSNARYIAIQKDFKVLSEKYQQLRVNSYQNFETKKIRPWKRYIQICNKYLMNRSTRHNRNMNLKKKNCSPN